MRISLWKGNGRIRNAGSLWKGTDRIQNAGSLWKGTDRIKNADFPLERKYAKPTIEYWNFYARYTITGTASGLMQAAASLAKKQVRRN